MEIKLEKIVMQQIPKQAFREIILPWGREKMKTPDAFIYATIENPVIQEIGASVSDAYKELVEAFISHPNVHQINFMQKHGFETAYNSDDASAEIWRLKSRKDNSSGKSCITDYNKGDMPHLIEYIVNGVLNSAAKRAYFEMVFIDPTKYYRIVPNGYKQYNKCLISFTEIQTGGKIIIVGSDMAVHKEVAHLVDIRRTDKCPYKLLSSQWPYPADAPQQQKASENRIEAPNRGRSIGVMDNFKWQYSRPR